MSNLIILRKIGNYLESKEPILLGIESSCDDSAMAILQGTEVLANVVFNQSIHSKYGGVIPEWASRKHMEAMVPLFEETMKKARLEKSNIDAIAVTRGPGLMGSLLVGLGFAKGLSFALNVPLIEVNHLEAHVFSVMLEKDKPEFPFLCLTVSGGHTQLVLVYQFGRYELMGTTLDDAAGEAFDKTGKMLGLNYPAGPEMDRLARSGQVKFEFPIAEMKAYDFSFSGLKTSVLYFLEKQIKNDPKFIEHHLSDLCASIQFAIVKALAQKTRRVMQECKISRLAVAGGVSANSGLRAQLQELSDKYQWELFFPSLEYCTDNAAMIAYIGLKKFELGMFSELHIEPLARYPLG